MNIQTLTFEDWMIAVNAEVEKITGGAMGLWGLSDWCSRDCYDNDYSPNEGAYEALETDDIGAAWLEESDPERG